MQEAAEMSMENKTDVNVQIYISYNGQEQMPMWAPPTPPQDENDVYVDYCMCFLFEPSVMPESQLPPVYVKREHKRLRVDTTSVGRKQKVRKDEAVSVPRSLFDRPTPALTKMRRDAKMQKIRGLPRPPVVCGYKPPAVVNKPIMDTQQDHPEWLIHEDWALLQAVQTLLELPLSLTVLSPAHTPNWDMVAEVVNATGRLYRSPKQCKGRYESVIVPREEGKILYDTNPKKQKKSKGIYRTKNNRPMRTSQLFIQDNNSSFSHLYHMRFETIKSVANKRTPTLKPLLVNPTLKNPKHAAVLAESNINYEQPLTPMQVATIRSERIAREKQKTQAAAAAATAELQLAAHRQQQQQHQAQALAQAQQAAATGGQQVGLTPAQQLQISVATAAASTLTGTATNLGSLCAQRGTTAGVSVRTNPQTVVSLTPAQVQAATQRITAANLAAVTSVSAGVVQTQATTQVATKNLTVQQMQALRTQTLFKQQQQQQQQQRLQRLQQVAQQQQQAAVAAAAQQQGASAAAAVAAAQAQAQKGSVVVSSPLATAAGVTALQVSQAQQRVQVGKQAVKPTRAMSDADLMQLIKRQPKSVTAGTGASVAQIQVPTQGQVTTQLLTHTQLQQMQQQQQAAGQTQVATLVKTVSTPTGLSGSPSVTIPMSAAVSLSIPNVKATVAGSKMAAVTQQSQLRQFQLQQQLLQRKMQQQQQQQQQQSQKVAQLAQQVQGKSQLPTQLGTVQIVQQAAATAQKQLSTVTVQQIQQVIKQVPQQNIQHLSQVTASGGSSLVTQSAAVSSAQIVSHGLLTKPTQATVTLAQTVAPTTVTAALHASSAGQSFTSGQTVQARVIPATSQSGAPIVAASIASPAAAAAAAAAKAAAIKQTIQVVTAAAGSPGLSPAQVQAAQMRGQVSTVGGQPVAVAVRTTTPLQTQHIAAGTSQTLTASQLPTQVPHSAAASVTAPVTLAALVGQNPAGGSVTGAPASQVALQQAKLQAAQQARSSSYTMRLRNPPKQ